MMYDHDMPIHHTGAIPTVITCVLFSLIVYVPVLVDGVVVVVVDVSVIDRLTEYVGQSMFLRRHDIVIHIYRPHIHGVGVHMHITNTNTHNILDYTHTSTHNT